MKDIETKFTHIKETKKSAKPNKTSIKKDKQQFTCNDCGTVFTRKENLIKHHEVSCSAKDLAFTCDGCGTSFARRGNLTRHRNSACSAHTQLDQVIGLFLLTMMR
jgi:RNase P subunit RPR2